MLGFNYFLNLFRKCLDIVEKPARFKVVDYKELLPLNQKTNKPYWLILRCTRCNNKSIPMLGKEEIAPVRRYCRHCGSERFYLEKRDDIEHLDTIYALHSRDLVSFKQVTVRYNNVNMDRKLKNPSLKNQNLQSQKEFNPIAANNQSLN